VDVNVSRYRRSTKTEDIERVRERTKIETLLVQENDNLFVVSQQRDKTKN